MSKGRIEQTASPAELYARPTTAFVAQFVGVSSRVPVTRSGDSVEVFGHDVPVRSGDPAAAAGSIDALLRPEELSVEVDAQGRGFVTAKNFLGATTRLSVQVGEVAVLVDMRSDLAADIDLGTRVKLSVLARDVLVAPRLVVDSSSN